MTQSSPESPSPAITIDDFAKLKLRIGKVLEAAPHPNADKLLVLKVDLGDEQRQLCAGIKGYYAPEQLVAPPQPAPPQRHNFLRPESGPGLGGGQPSPTKETPSGSGLFRNRTGDSKEAAIKEHGGGSDTEDAVNLGLEYLARQQESNGSWNPNDGGSFEQIVRKLTVDSKGNNAASPNFDRKSVAAFGYQNPGAGGMLGQTEWSHFAASNGFRHQDKPWDPKFHFDDPRLAETLGWLATLPATSVPGVAPVMTGPLMPGPGTSR